MAVGINDINGQCNAVSGYLWQMIVNEKGQTNRKAAYQAAYTHAFAAWGILQGLVND